MIDAGFTQVFVSNSDNLGAVPDPRVAGWFAVERRAVRHRGGPPHAERPQGRPLRPAEERRPDRAAGDRADAARGRRGARRPRPAPVRLDEQPVVRPPGDEGRARPAGRDPRPVDDQATSRPSTPPTPQPRGGPDRDRDGRGDRGLRGLPDDRGRPRPVRPGEDDQRPARAAQRLLRARRRRGPPPGAAERCRSWTSTSPTSWSGGFEERFPAGPPSLREATVVRRPRRLEVRGGRRRRRRGRGGRGRLVRRGAEPGTRLA